MRISGDFSLAHTSNSNKFILPETLIINELRERNPLPCQKVDFSAVKKIELESEEYYKQRGDVIANEFIRHVFRSSENLEKVIINEGFGDFVTNTSNLLVIPTQRKLKFLYMSVSSPEKTLSQLLLVLKGLADHVNLETKKCKLDLKISYEAEKSLFKCDNNFEVRYFAMTETQTQLVLIEKVSSCIIQV